MNIISVIQGITVCCLSPYFPLLQSENSPLTSGPVSTTESSWIGALLSVGGLLGSFLFNFIINKFGKKVGLMLLAVPQTGYWLCVVFGNSVNFLYFARFLTGMTGGGMVVIIPLYVADVADKEIRGILGSMFAMFSNVGYLLGYIIGNFFSYEMTSWIMLPCPLIFVACVTLLPETPLCLLRKGKVEEAEKSLMFYRDINDDYEEEEFKNEFNSIMKSYETQKLDQEVSHLSIGDFMEKNARRGICLGVFLMFVNQFSGYFAILQYTSTIFDESGSSLTSNESTIIVGALQIIGSFVSFFIIDRFGRKALLLISVLGTGLGELCIAIYAYLSELGYDLKGFEWIPILSLSFTIFVVNLGLVGIPFVIIPEMIPKKILSTGNIICMTTFNISAFSVLLATPLMLEAIKLYGTMWFFAGVCGGGFLILALFLTETKGKDLHKDEN